MQISPIAIDTSLSDQTVTVSIDVTDDLSGVNYVYVYLTSPSTGQKHYVGLSTWNGTQPDPINNPLKWHLTGTITFPQYAEAGTWQVTYIEGYDNLYNGVWFDPRVPQYHNLAATLDVLRPSLAVDGTVGAAGGIVQDNAFGDRAQITIPPNTVPDNTTVSIDVFPNPPISVPLPTGFSTEGSYYVNIHLDPAPAYPLDPPGLTVVLPLVNPMPVGMILNLYRINTDTGALDPSTNVYHVPTTGTVDSTGLTATFTGVSRLSTVVGLIADPVITWDNPDDITYGTALSVEQLNATVDVQGSLSYSPAAGTVLNAGSGQTLNVTFTPYDPAYKSVSKSVVINVLKAPLTITADNKTKVSGTPNPVFTATITGFVNGDTSLTTDSSFTTTATDSSPAGKYDIIAQGAVADNYQITYQDGTLTVTAPAAAVLKATSYSLASYRRITQTVWEYTYRLTITNSGNADAHNVIAKLTGSSRVTVIHDSVTFSEVAAGKSVTSQGTQNTFTIQIDRTTPLQTSDLTWTFTAK